MKFPKWYHTDNLFGFFLLAGQFNPNGSDYGAWDKGWLVVVLCLDLSLMFSIAALILLLALLFQ